MMHGPIHTKRKQRVPHLTGNMVLQNLRPGYESHVSALTLDTAYPVG